MLGILVSIVIAYLIYRGLVRINLSRFFLWTGLFLIVVAAGVLSYGIGDLQEAGVLPGNGQAAYSLATVIPPSSWYGVVLAGLFNYTAEPTWARLIAWALYLAVVTPLFLRVASAKARPASPSHSTQPGDIHA